VSDGSERPEAAASTDAGSSTGSRQPSDEAAGAAPDATAATEPTVSEEPTSIEEPVPSVETAASPPPEPPAQKASPAVEAGAPAEVTSTPADPSAPAEEDAQADAKEGDRKPDGESRPDGESKPARRKPKFPSLMRAFRSGRPVEGKIVQVIKGGYEIRVGRARGFCPHSQVDLQREDDPESQVGKTYVFKITQLRRGGEDIVLSRRMVLEEERAEEAKAVRATLIEGAVMQGHVVGTAPFGAFVDLGAGVLGLAHISELSHQRINSVDEAVKVGDAVNVRILKLKESGRISLSIRRAEDDPWADVESKFEVGKDYDGKITRLADFGAFVEIAPGVEALAPASEFPPAPGGWRDGLDVGGESRWRVLSVDRKARRVSVTPPGEESAAESLVEGAERKGRVQRIERYGVFVWLGPGRVGLMPRAMTGAPEGADLRRGFHIGDAVEVTVVSIEEGGRRIRLCKQGVKPTSEEEMPRSQARSAPAHEEPAESFGTSLADKLRAALGQAGDDS